MLSRLVPNADLYSHRAYILKRLDTGAYGSLSHRNLLVMENGYLTLVSVGGVVSCLTTLCGAYVMLNYAHKSLLISDLV